jgi:hypothetical protein
VSIRRRRSKDLHRFPIDGLYTPTSYLAPLPRYRGSKVDRKRFRPYGDVTGRKGRRHSTGLPRFPIGPPCMASRVSHSYRDIAVRRWTGSGFGHTVTSYTGSDDAVRYTDPGFLSVLNARRPRISHRYRNIAVPRWTGNSFGHTVTSQGETDAAIRKIDPGFPLVLHARRPRIWHRYRDITVLRWTGSGFRRTMTSQSESDAAIRQICLGFL